MASTLGVSTRSESRGGESEQWLVALATAERLGSDEPPRWTRLAEGERLAVGRESEALGGAFVDDRISRTHAELEVEAGVLSVRDTGSRNGTTVNGQRTVKATLSPGDFIGTGSAVLVVFQAAGDWVPLADDDLHGLGPVHRALVEAVRTVAPQPAPVLLTGETGTGKDHLATLIHARSGRSGSLVAVDCAALADGAAAAELLGEGGLVEQARGGTLYLDGITDATAPTQAALTRLVETGAYRREGREVQADVRVIASSLEDPEDAVAKGLLKPGFAARLSQWVVAVPPLRERREDVALLAAALARRFTGDAVALHPRLVGALVGARWPTNLHGLRGAVERAIAEAGGERPVPRPEFLRRGPAGPSTADAVPRLEVGPGCSWFRCGSETADLSRRPSLAGVLRFLVSLHAEQPNVVASPIDLVHAGWPGEAMSERAGINRVYVAVSTLRKLGLRDLIVRSRSGYRLDAQAVVHRHA